MHSYKILIKIKREKQLDKVTKYGCKELFLEKKIIFCPEFVDNFKGYPLKISYESRLQKLISKKIEKKM